MGIRKKISLGFLSLALLLFFSGMVSFFELEKLSKETKEILELSTVNMDLSKRMLDAVEHQNSSLLQMIMLQSEQFDEEFLSSRSEFENALQSVSENEHDKIELNEIYSANSNYYQLVEAYFDDELNTDIAWFLDMYKTSYNHLTTAIKTYMISSQHRLMARSEQLEGNAYRAITPGIITLCVAILIIIVFSFLIDTYYTRPILQINKSLRSFLKHRLPFNVKMEGRDEIFELKEQISDLTRECRKSNEH